MLLKPGQQATVGRYTLRNDGVKVTDDGQKQMVTAYMAVFEDGKQIDTMYPAQVVLPQARAGADHRGGDPAHARRGPLHRAAGAIRPAARRRRALQIVVNPLVNWIWLGFGVHGVRHRHRAAAGARLLVRAGEAAGRRGRDGDAALAAGASCSAARPLLGADARVRSQTQTSMYCAATPLEKQMQHEIVCTCGWLCRTIAECRKCTCAHAARDARRARGADRLRARRTTRSSRRSSRSTAARRCSARRSTRASTAWRGCSRICSAPAASLARRLRRRQVVAAGVGAEDPRAALRPIPTSNERLDDELRNLD